jgi:hypothetical protein
MANVYTYQILKDTTEKAVIKLTATFDGTGQESNVSRISANTLYGALTSNNNVIPNGTPLSYYGLTVTRIGYNIASQQKGYVQLFWTGSSAANNSTIMNLDLSGEYSEDQGMVSIPNNAIGATGDIGVQTFGLVANSAYTMVLELRKQNEYYSRGQFRDPAAFNYKPYGVTTGPNGA